jgi:release factor glutamine methyltransferase
MLYSDFIESVEGRLQSIYGSREGRAIALRLLQHYCGISSYEHIINPEGEISAENMIELEKAEKELVTARPLQYVLGFQEFYGRKFRVEEGVLIPRPETEELVRWILEDCRRISGTESTISEIHVNGTDRQTTVASSRTRILDAACGSGCIGITLVCEITNSEVFALDLSDKAFEVTTANATELLNTNGSFLPFKCDLLARPSIQSYIEERSLDILVSNPPYVKESERKKMKRNVLDFEPAEALFVPDDDPMLFYSALCQWGEELLKPSGRIYLEINEAHGHMVAKLLESSGFTQVTIRKDLSGKDRMVRGTRRHIFVPRVSVNTAKVPHILNYFV